MKKMFILIFIVMALCVPVFAQETEDNSADTEEELALPEKPLDDAEETKSGVGLDGVEELELGVATDVEEAGNVGVEYVGMVAEIDFGGLFASMSEYNSFIEDFNKELDSLYFDGEFSLVSRLFSFSATNRWVFDTGLGLISPYVSGSFYLLAFNEERNNSDGRKVVLKHNITSLYAGAGIRKYIFDRKDAEYTNPYIGVDLGYMFNFGKLEIDVYDTVGELAELYDVYPGYGSVPQYLGNFCINFEVGGDILTDVLDAVLKAGYKLIIGSYDGETVTGTGLSGPYVRMGVAFGREK